MNKRQKVELKFRLPEGRKWDEDDRLVQWFGAVVGVANLQGIDCELFVDGKHVDVSYEVIPPAEGEPS